MPATHPPIKEPRRGTQKKYDEFVSSSPENAVFPYRIAAKHRGAKSRAALMAPLENNLASFELSKRLTQNSLHMIILL